MYLVRLCPLSGADEGTFMSITTCSDHHCSINKTVIINYTAWEPVNVAGVIVARCLQHHEGALELRGGDGGDGGGLFKRRESVTDHSCNTGIQHLQLFMLGGHWWGDWRKGGGEIVMSIFLYYTVLASWTSRLQHLMHLLHCLYFFEALSWLSVEMHSHSRAEK